MPVAVPPSHFTRDLDDDNSEIRADNESTVSSICSKASVESRARLVIESIFPGFRGYNHIYSDPTLHSSYKEKASKITAKEMAAAGLAASKLFVVGLKSPMTFAMNIAKGLHNAPKLYNDRTVRETEKITGIQSGVKAAGKVRHA